MSRPTGHRGALAAEALALATLLGLLVVYVSRPIWDIDIFWHIAAGRAFVHLGEIPTTDIFSAIDAERTWVTFQYGYELWVWLLEQAGGLQLVKAAHAGVMVLGFTLFWYGCRHRLDLGTLASLVATALLLVLFEDRIRARPHVFNLLAWSLLFPWLLAGPVALGRRAIVATAVVVFLWANLHAGGALLFLVAAATLPAGALASRLLRVDTGPPDALRRASLWWGGAVASALVAPNFVRGNLQALTMLEGTEHAIAEWAPSWSFLAEASVPGHVVSGLFPSLVALAWLVVVARVIRSAQAGDGGWRATLRDTPPWVLLLGLALVVLSHRSVRFVYTATFAALLLAPHLPAAFRPSAWTPAVRRGLGVTALALLLCVAHHFNVVAQHGDLATAARRAFSGPPLDTRRFPTAQAEFLQRTGFEGNILCQGNWGGYLLWALWPDARVTADGRGNYARAVTDDLLYLYDRSHFTDPANGPTVRAIYERYPVDAVVHQHPVWPKGYRPPPDTWTLVFRDAKGAIWVRDTERGRAWLERLRELKSEAEATSAPLRAPATPR